MPFVFTMPTGISDELEQAFATIVAQVGAIGKRVDIPFQTRYFSVDTGTITVTEGNLRVFSYTILGDHLLVIFDLVGMSVTGTPNIITITAPEGFRMRPGDRHNALYNRLYTQPVIVQTDVGDKEPGEVWVTNSAATTTIGNDGRQVSLHVHQLDDGVWTAGTQIAIQGHCLFEYERVP